MISTIFKGLYLFIKDIIKGNNANFFPNGVHCFVGLPGTGKTLTMTHYINKYKQLYPKAIIVTNYGYIYQDLALNHWRDLINLDNGTDGIIFVIDEIQNTFFSKNWKDFPMDMIPMLTQNRKKAKMILCSTQSYAFMVMDIRRLCNYVIECKNYFGRIFFCRYFHAIAYDEFMDNSLKRRLFIQREWFVGTDELFSMYDTLRIVESMNNDFNSKYAEMSNNNRRMLQNNIKLDVKPA